MADAGGQNVRVMTRVRLFNKREIEISASEKKRLQSVVRMRDKTCAIMEYYTDERGFPQEKEREAMEFDECFWSIPADQAMSLMPLATQQFVYERSGLLALQAALSGYNVTIFAYGQTGSGKTYSMLGAPNDVGISLRMVDDLFGGEKNPCIKMTVECMFMEIYNEKVRDLFNKKTKVGDYDAPKIRQHPVKGVFVEGLNRKEVTTGEQTKHLIEKGSKERAMAETKMNAHSSRSHAIFQIQITQSDAMKGTQKISTINLVDLAGSEKVKTSGASGETLNEAKAINQSLSTLRKVIDVLIDNSKIKNKKNHKIPPFRESVLTYVLSDSLGGNSKTMMLAAISPHEANVEETIGTLRYALRAKAIVCDAKVNEEKSAAMMEAMRDEIMALQVKLRDGKGGGMSEEIRVQIEERQKEYEKMEDNQKQMETMLEEAEKQKVEMQQKLKEVDEAKAELNIVVEAQKRERFALAFRNAFMISQDKKQAEKSKVELEELRALSKNLEKERDQLQTDLDEKSQLYEELLQSSEKRLDELTKGVTERDGHIATLKRQLSASQQEAQFMKDQNASLQLRVQGLESIKSELEKRVQRLQDEVLVGTAKIDMLMAEKGEMQDTFDEQKKALNEELENMRKRKDKYKLAFMESKAKFEAAKGVIDAFQTDRQSFLGALKAQQSVVEEQSATVKRIVDERKQTEQKTRVLERAVQQKEDDMRLMSEALREYQNAASEFTYENHTMQKELEKAARQNFELKAAMHSNGVALSPSPLRSAPRAVSPMVGGSQRLSTNSPRRLGGSQQLSNTDPLPLNNGGAGSPNPSFTRNGSQTRSGIVRR